MLPMKLSLINLNIYICFEIVIYQSLTCSFQFEFNCPSDY